eukprot:4068088-Pyramimonas_sp.AAC.1
MLFLTPALNTSPGAVSQRPTSRPQSGRPCSNPAKSERKGFTLRIAVMILSALLLSQARSARSKLAMPAL